MKNKKIVTILSICIVIITASLIHRTFENDTFFTIPTGNYILQNGVNDVEPFTWHENLKFTKLRWGFDVVVATIYNVSGFNGVYIFTVCMSAIIGIMLFTNLVRRKNNVIVAFFVTIFTIACLSQCLKCRGQIMSYLLFGLEIYSIQMLLETGKKKYGIYLVLISFGILTFHSSVWLAHFIFYLPYILEWFLVKIKIKNVMEDTGRIELEERGFDKMKMLFITMGIVLITGFLTPLKLSPFTYMFKVIGGYSSKIINELQPLVLSKASELIIIVFVVLGLLSLSKAKIKLTDICLIVGLIIMSKMAIRNLYIALSVLPFPLASVITSYVEAVNKKDLLDKLDEKLNKNYYVMVIAVLISVVVAINNYKLIYKEPFVDEDSYPVQASEFIKNNIDMSKMKIYNHFNFGSYMELQGIPTFMDSRSEVYCKEFSNVTILEDFGAFDLNQTMTPEEMVEKYGITHFIFKSNNSNAYNMKNSGKYQELYDDGKFVILEVRKFAPENEHVKVTLVNK